MIPFSNLERKPRPGLVCLSGDEMAVVMRPIIILLLSKNWCVQLLREEETPKLLQQWFRVSHIFLCSTSYCTPRERWMKIVFIHMLKIILIFSQSKCLASLSFTFSAAGHEAHSQDTTKRMGGPRLFWCDSLDKSSESERRLHTLLEEF